MEINLNSNGYDNIGVGREALDVMQSGAKPETTGASQASRSTSLNISSPSPHAQSVDLSSAEPVADVPPEALSRDDELGKLVSAAFSLPPPPMPSFM